MVPGLGDLGQRAEEGQLVGGDFFVPAQDALDQVQRASGRFVEAGEDGKTPSEACPAEGIGPLNGAPGPAQSGWGSSEKGSRACGRRWRSKSRLAAVTFL